MTQKELPKKFEYDVIFSLAGERKDYVEEVANYIKEKGIKVWYYGFKEAEIEMWGKNQVDIFDKLFSKSAKYCVVFISREYTEKIWPNLERQFIQSRWLKDPNYLLPARFDDALVIGIPETINYISLKDKSPEKFGDIIVRKIKEGSIIERSQQLEDIQLPRTKQSINPYEERNQWIHSITEELRKRCRQVTDADFFDDDLGQTKQIRVMYKGDVVFSLDIHKKGLGDDRGISFSVGERMGNGINAFGSFEWSKEKNCVVLNLSDMSLLESSVYDKCLTKEEFIESLWVKIVNIIEEKY